MSETVIGTEADEAGLATDPTAPAEVEANTTEAADSTEDATEASADEAAEENDDDADDENGEDVLVQEGDIAGDYLERLLDILDFDGDIDLDVEAGRAIVSIDGGEDLDKLVGPRGNVLESLQELTRLAVQQETGNRTRLMLDVAGWRAKRREELRELGRSTAESVASSGERVRMQPMSPFERKVVHDAVATVDGVTSESEGEEPKRRVVVLPE